MSGLYAGITFSNGGAQAGSSGSSSSAANNGTPAGAQSNPVASTLDEAARYAAQAAEQAAKDAAEKEKRAALGFAPVVRRKAAVNKPKIGIAAGLAAAAAPSTSASAAGSSSSAASTSTAPVIAAAPLLYNNAAASVQTAHPASASAQDGTADSTSTSTAPGVTGRTLIAPSMTLDDEDVNGFKATSAGKKASKKNKKSKGRPKREEGPALSWTAEYDPARPTDYAEYKIWSKVARAERREQMRREKERQRRIKEGYGESGSGSEYSSYDSGDDSEEERRRKLANAENRFFAPPKSYHAEESPQVEEDKLSVAAAAPADVDMQADKPYEPSAAEKAAESDWAAWSAAPTVSEDPYARRLALSRQTQSNPLQPPPLGSSNVSPQPPLFAQPAMPSQPPAPSFGQQTIPPQPPQLPPGFVMPPSSMSPPSIPLPHGGTMPLPPHMGAPSPHHGLPVAAVSPNPLSHNQPPSIPFQPANSNTPGGSGGGGVSIEEAQARAKAIAAKLAGMSKLGGASGSASPVPGVAPTAASPYTTPIPGSDNEATQPGPSSGAGAATREASTSNPQDFAKNLMAKYGWSKGQGLGATSQGMLNPLALSTDGKSSKGKGKQEVQPQGSQKVTGMATAKGRVVSDLKTEKDKAEREKYGEPSRVVCLSNMVGRDEVDDELVADVADEAKKLGVLEKCFVHVMPKYVADDDSVRVFVIFTGLVGAWKAVKAFDGRFFGGRTVKAKFYNEMAIEMGTLHL